MQLLNHKWMNAASAKYILKIVFCIALFCTPFFVKAGQHNDDASIRSVPDSVAERMKKEKEFRYANDPSFWLKEKEEEDSAFAKWVQSMAVSPLMKWLVYLFLAAILILAVYQVMVVNDFFMFAGSSKKKKEEAGDVHDARTDNLDDQLSKAVSNKEYRQAVRILYLKTLHLLHEKNRIKLHAKSTNHDYLVQMKHHRAAGEFTSLTRIYEYVWYGEYQPGEDQYEIISSSFHQFNKQA
jgi:Domain of unknown function (DUF4129)